MNPFPGPQSVLVMDNCALHHNAHVRELCEEADIRVKFLPAYSPDLNPVSTPHGRSLVTDSSAPDRAGL
jgi:transposase